MPYNQNQPFQYGIPDGTYTGRPTTASCFEKDGRLILDVKFEVKDPESGQWYKKDNGYNWEANKRHWLTSKDGAFNQATINGIKEWAKGWNPQGLDDFWWFQNPDANGTPFGNLAAIGEVELNFATDKDGNQTIWVHDPDRPKSGGRKAFVPDGASTDLASIKAKWGTKAKALFGCTPCRSGASCGGPDASRGGSRQGEAVGGLSADGRRRVRVLLRSPEGAAQGGLFEREARRDVVRHLRRRGAGERPRRVHARGRPAADGGRGQRSDAVLKKLQLACPRHGKAGKRGAETVRTA